jgi:hypothetical protein
MAFVLPDRCAASSCHSTPWRFSCRRRGWLGAALRLPSRGGRTLLRPRPESAIRVGAPRHSHGPAPPSPQRGSRVRCPRAPERFATHGTGGLNAPRSRCGAAHRAEDSAERNDSCWNLARGWVVVTRPAGDRSHGAEACGDRSARPAGGDAGPDRASHAREGNSEGPHAGLCLLGRTRRRVGGLGSTPSPSGRSRPVGQTSLHAVDKSNLVLEGWDIGR